MVPVSPDSSLPPAVQVKEAGQRARAASRILAALPSNIKNEALQLMAEALIDDAPTILAANRADLATAERLGLSDTILDRLTLTPGRVGVLAEGVREVASLPDPVGETITGSKQPNGLSIRQVRAPLGVVGIIYEGFPNVTAETAALCLKSGNSVILHSGAHAFNSNAAIADALIGAIGRTQVPADVLQFIRTTAPEGADRLLRLNSHVDLLIPRGGPAFTRAVCETATVPTIFTGSGNCHTYVHSTAPLDMAADITFNAKVQRPGVYNAMETLLVDREIAEEFLSLVGPRFRVAGVELRGCPETRKIIPDARLATEEDWHTDYLALILAVKVVDDLEAAITHINHYGSKHSEAIVTRDYFAMRRFCQAVDAAAVYVNASTRFTDGGEFGMGAEVGISTQKLHARGPMGLSALTTYKWNILGDGQVRE